MEPLGDLTAAELPALLDRLSEVVADTNASGVVIVFSAVHQVDAAALGAVRAAREVVHGHGGRLVLAGAGRHLEHALSVSDLSDVGAVYGSLEAASACLHGLKNL